MKRSSFLLLFLAFLFLLPLLAACGGALPEETETKAPVTAETAASPQTKTEEEKGQKDPAEDGVFRVLMVGNSFCSYYADELYGMLAADGLQAEVANVYYSGCFVKWHWEWLLTNQMNYLLRFTTKSGRREENDVTLKHCLEARNWDVITLQQHFNPNTTVDYDTALASCTPYVEKLFKIFRNGRELTNFYWHETWAYQVGYDFNNQVVPTLEAQTHQYEILSAVSRKMCEDNDLPMIPSGDAWQRARLDPVIGDTLCNRLKDGGDCYHDGDVGGGQLLNACVWYEVLTGKDCRENTFRPTAYSISDEKIAAIKNAAHETVEEMNG